MMLPSSAPCERSTFRYIVVHGDVGGDLAVGNLELAAAGDERVAAGGVDEDGGAHLIRRLPSGPTACTVTPSAANVHVLDPRLLAHLGAERRRVVEQHLVEVGALDLIGVGIAGADRVCRSSR